MLEIGTNRPLKNLKKKMANIGQNIKRMPELHAFKNVLSNVRHSVHCAVHDMRCRRHQKYRYTTFIGPPYTIIFIYSTIITMDTEANFLFFTKFSWKLTQIGLLFQGLKKKNLLC